MVGSPIVILLLAGVLAAGEASFVGPAAGGASFVGLAAGGASSYTYN